MSPAFYDELEVLDLVPKGRDEASLPYPSAWWRHHDRYEDDSERSGCASEKRETGDAAQ